MTIRLDNGSVSGGGGGVTDHALLSNLDSANAAHTGYQATIISSDLTAVAPISINGGVGALLSGTTLSMAAASTAVDGYLTSADFATFYNKQATITSANVVGTANQILVSGGTGSVLATVTLSLPQSIGTASNVEFDTVQVDKITANADTSTFQALSAGAIRAGASIFTSITAGAGTSTFQAIQAGAVVTSAILATVGTSNFFGASVVSNVVAASGTGQFNTVLAGASIFTSITAGAGTSTFQAIRAGAAVVSSIIASVGTSNFFGASVVSNVVASSGTGQFNTVLAGASIFTSVTAQGASSYFNAIGAGASIISSIQCTTVGTSTFSAIGAGASIFTSASFGTNTMLASPYAAFIGGSLRMSGTYVGVFSSNIAGTGTAFPAAISATNARGAGYLTFVFRSGTSAFVPFFLSSST